MSGGVQIYVPGVPVPKGRPRFARQGNFVRTYTPKKTGDYEGVIRAIALDVMRGKEIYEGPVRVTIHAWLPIPQSWSQKKKAAAKYPTGKPDSDNYGKAAMDALNGVVFRDDSQAVDVLIHKRYGPPCLTINVTPIIEVCI